VVETALTPTVQSVLLHERITSFRDSQEQARDIVEDEGEFVLIYVKCSVEAAEKHDPKGF
jgi:adenylylsulfate kinase-like enzyme